MSSALNIVILNGLLFIDLAKNETSSQWPGIINVRKRTVTNIVY